MDIKHIPIVEKKKLVASGASVVVVIPRQWLEENGLGAGSEVLMVANGDLKFMKISKDNVDKLRKSLVHIQTDSIVLDSSKVS